MIVYEEKNTKIPSGIILQASVITSAIPEK